MLRSGKDRLSQTPVDIHNKAINSHSQGAPLQTQSADFKPSKTCKTPSAQSAPSSTAEMQAVTVTPQQTTSDYFSPKKPPNMTGLDNQADNKQPMLKSKTPSMDPAMAARLDPPLATLLSEINGTLTHLLDSNEDLTKQFGKLTTSNNDLKEEFQKLSAAIAEDIQSAKTLIEDKTTKIEKNILDSINKTVSDIQITCDTRNIETLTSVEEMKAQAHKDNLEVTSLKAEVGRQKDTISDLELKLGSTVIKCEELEFRLNDFILQIQTKTASMQEGIYSNTKLANDVEGHGRRWAVRIMGLPAPTGGKESVQDAKKIVIQFILEHLKVSNVAPQESDCAHRVGRISTESKQTMLVRFFKRDLTDHLLSKKKLLKTTDYVMFEDTTWLNRRLINALNRRPDIEKAWCIGGTVWAKARNTDQKTKVGINDDLDELFSSIYNATSVEAEPNAEDASAHSDTQLQPEGNPQGSN
jgi:hypothetical protein